MFHVWLPHSPKPIFRILIFAVASAVSLASAPAAFAGSGGSVVVITPKIKSISCIRRCAARGAIQAGSTLRIKGDDLNVVKQVLFLGSRGKSDDTSAAPIVERVRMLTVKVPAGSGSGSLQAISHANVRSRPSSPIAIRPMPPVVGDPALAKVSGTSAGITLETGTSTPRVVFLGAKQLVKFSLRVGGIDNAVANVQLVKQSDGQAVANWSLPAPAGQIVSIEWNGRSGQADAPVGRYAFTVSIAPGAQQLATASSGPLASTSADATRDAFDLYGHVFPVRGKHDFGQGGARFGAGRGGRSHQGQDIMARCGTKLVAARGGEVIQSSSQGAAGNYLVIRPENGGDNAYMHLISRSPFRKGDRVYTGQAIGNVGRTGDATACHLHFEEWTGEIWRSRPFNPLPDLLDWDQVS